MKDTPTRIITIACVLVGVWVIAYWLYQPARAITTDPRPSEIRPGATPAPETQTPAQPSSADLRPRIEPLPTPDPAPSSRTKRVQKRIAPEFRDYVVQKGDASFERVAAHKEVFGDARLGSVIASANPYTDPTKLKPGVTVLHIPVDPENVTGKLVWVDEAVPDGAPTPVPEPTPTPTPPPVGKSYTIQKGDTLWKVAEQFYGKGYMWKTIADANRDVMPNPDRPKLGTVIHIPPAP